MKDMQADSSTTVVPIAPGRGLVRPVRPGVHPVKSYEELDGAQGKAVHFRPERYSAGDLALVRPVVTLSLSGEMPIACQLHDLSQNGIAFTPPHEARLVPGTTISELVVSFDGTEVFRGEARVVSARSDDGIAVVGATFIDSLMNIDDVLHLRDVKSWKAGDERGVAAGVQPWYVPGHETFKALVCEMRLFLDGAVANYSEMEPGLPWHVVHGEGDSAARSALIERIRAEFVPDFIRIMGGIDLALRSASGDDWHRLKEFSIRTLHETLMQAPLLHRTRVKPLGYPGDFEAMHYMYTRNFEGQSLFAKALHMGSCASVPAQAVRARKNLIRDRIRALAEGWTGDRPLRVASVAAGPAQELYELLNQPMDIPVPVEVVLFDQDKLALTFAHRRIGPLIEGRWRGRVRVTFLHDTIKRLLTDPGIFGDYAPFDMMFAAGLFDYLRFNTATTLTRNLFANLAPGGRAYIGNMDPSNPSRWMFEHHLDWHLIYRTKIEMLEFGQAAVPGAGMEIVEDATGINPFLVIQKA
ncbi:MAG: PilZ domain-containing protein [Deltaproteobacteria bacterium]|nr:PilZ domain-containing protein [Deltaproteobacteria bacterium]